jgi:hypothetical protein
VDLATDEIRWLDALASMKAQPESMTFDLPPSQFAQSLANEHRFRLD